MSYKWTWKMPKWFQKLYKDHWNNCALLNGGDKCTCNKPSPGGKNGGGYHGTSWLSRGCDRNPAWNTEGYLALDFDCEVAG